MPKLDFIHSIQLPELKIVNNYRASKNELIFEARKLSDFEVCLSVPLLQKQFMTTFLFGLKTLLYKINRSFSKSGKDASTVGIARNPSQNPLEESKKDLEQLTDSDGISSKNIKLQKNRPCLASTSTNTNTSTNSSTNSNTNF